MTTEEEEEEEEEEEGRVRSLVHYSQPGLLGRNNRRCVCDNNDTPAASPAAKSQVHPFNQRPSIQIYLLPKQSKTHKVRLSGLKANYWPDYSSTCLTKTIR